MTDVKATRKHRTTKRQTRRPRRTSGEHLAVAVNRMLEKVATEHPLGLPLEVWIGPEIEAVRNALGGVQNEVGIPLKIVVQPATSTIDT